MSEQRRKRSGKQGNGSGQKRAGGPAPVAPSALPVRPVQPGAAAPAAAAPTLASVATMPRPPRFFQLIPNNLAFNYLRWRWYAIGASWGTQ